jgi:uncharacterized protein (TIGR00299 family) protein
MKIAYFDAPSGLSGNMILGALLDAGLEPGYLKKELRKLQTANFKLQNNAQIIISKTKKHGLAGTYFNVGIKRSERHRNLSDILKIIKRSKLSKNVKALSSRIFRRLAAAEAKVHGVTINRVHFHEVGAVDAIVDIVGTCIGLEKLGIEKLYCSPLPNGQGGIVHAHGLLPNPAPATAELLREAPTYGTRIKGELVTPTGAAIMTTLADSFGDLPRLEVAAIGYGAGSLDLPLPNLLRVFIGEVQIPAERDAVLQIESNLDDMSPGSFSKIINKLMKAGALDASVEPVYMKKERTGFKLSVLCEPGLRDQIMTAIFDLSTTFGVRVYVVGREKLSRKFIKVRTKHGQAKVKLGYLGNKLKTVAPEYEDYKRIARKHHLPLSRAYRQVVRASIPPSLR